MILVSVRPPDIEADPPIRLADIRVIRGQVRIRFRLPPFAFCFLFIGAQRRMRYPFNRGAARGFLTLF